MSRPRRADPGHVVGHHLVALLRHARHLGQRPIGREADAEKADAERRADLETLVEVCLRLDGDLMHVRQRLARQLELAARLQRDRAARLALGAFQRDDGVALPDGLPAVPVDQALHQGAHAALALVRHGLQGVGAEEELLVLGADAPALRRLRACGDPGDEVVTRVHRLARRCVLAGGHRVLRILLSDGAWGGPGWWKPQRPQAALPQGSGSTGIAPQRPDRGSPVARPGLAPVPKHGVDERKGGNGRGIGAQDARSQRDARDERLR